MIDRRLYSLRMLEQHGTVIGTADAVHLTPSAVSQQLRSLSKELGVDLLEAHGRKVRLTSAAQTLLRYADALYALWEQAESELAAHRAGEAGVLRLCAFPTAVAALVAPAAAMIRQRMPLVVVRVVEAEPADAINLLLSADVDVALVEANPATPPPTDKRFTQSILLDDPQDLLVPRGHHLASRPPVALADAATEPWIISEPTSSYRQLVEVFCASAGFTPQVEHQAKDWSAVIGLVAAGLGVALIPRLVNTSIPHAVRIPLKGTPKPSRRILTYLRRGSENTPLIQLALQILRQQATSPGNPPRI